MLQTLRLANRRSFLRNIQCLGLGCLAVGACDLSKPFVPVVVSWRHSLIPGAMGVVVIFTNQTSRQLTINVTWRNEEYDGKFALNLEPNGWREIGTLQGMVFCKGAYFTLSHPDYRSITTQLK